MKERGREWAAPINVSRHEPADSTAPPERLGPCRLLTALGSGGMGTVWRAEMLEDRPWAGAGSTVAVKVIHPYRVLDQNAFARFAREASLGSAIDHPAVIRTLSADTATIAGREWRYLVME